MNEKDDTRQRIESELQQAEDRAWKALAGYKFQMFGYWAAIWVHLNRIGRCGRPNPFREAVGLARTRAATADQAEKAEPAQSSSFQTVTGAPVEPAGPSPKFPNFA